MKVTLKTSKDGHGQVTLAQGFSYFFQLVRSVGVFSALKTAITTAIQLFGTDGGGFHISPSTSSKDLLPFLRNAPLDWYPAIEELLNNVKKNGHPNDTDLIQSLVQRVAEVVQKSNNKPEIAEITICIPAYNNFLEVATCVESIATHPSRIHYQILIADDASPDCNFSPLGNIPGITVLRNNSNLGYINNVNAATNNISTEFILTLNQDTIVCPGWLDELVLEMQHDPLNSVVGPCVLSPQFAIQEAGGLIFNDASAAHRGRGFDVNDPRFSFSREVDYVSGCAMLIRTSVWKQFGGLNNDLSPAYYDDVDFCIRAHQAGMFVRYTPLAFVIHAEGTSMGRDKADGNSPKSFQLVNQVKVATTHQSSLSSHTDFDNSPRVETHYRNRQRIVCIFDTVPRSDRDGGSIDFELFVNYLIQLDYEVIALFIHQATLEDTSAWRAVGVCCAKYDSALGRKVIEESTIICSFGTMVAIKLCADRISDKIWIHHTSDIVTRRVESFITLTANQTHQSTLDLRWNLGLPRDVETMWRLEKPTLELPSAVLIVTDNDLQYVRQRGAVGNFIHFPIFRGAPTSPVSVEPLNQLTVGFVGSFLHSPNIDAVQYFLETTWPIIIEKLPDAKFLIWGSGLNDDQKSAWSMVPSVEVRGWFATWNDVVAETRVLVSPLRFGAGMKHKVVSNLIHGRPVVGTYISFEGFQTALLNDTIMTDDPSQMAKSTIEILLSNEAWRSALSAGLAALGNGFGQGDELESVRSLLNAEISRKKSQPVTIST